MKRVFGRVEAVFDICYLLAAAGIGITLLFTARYTTGAMALLLVGGDAFHLIPRILTILGGQEETMRQYLGRGKQITSITMTVFYLLLWQAATEYSGSSAPLFQTAAIYLLAVVRIFLCLLPQNRWEERYPPVRWGILRNIPFFLLGLLVAGRLFTLGSSLGGLQWAWLPVVLSFLCYIPVVLWANRNPKVGTLMLPKTCMYLWLLAMCLSA